MELRHVVLGRPRDVTDRRLFHRVSLVAFLAWVGLGADGLSSSAYGPEEAFRALGRHTYLAVALAAVMAGTVVLISAAYRRIIEEFPTGGGGYVVASKLLGPAAGVVSGSALLVDYVLTITISIAAAGDALFSFLPAEWRAARLPVEFALILLLTTLNIRGVRESVLALVPVFLLFVVSHALLIAAGVGGHLARLPHTLETVRAGVHHGVATVGIWGLLLVFVRAYSLGGGTYTGIEAVSNGLPIMREPQVQTGKRTMIYMGTSLALTASGLLLCYLLWGIAPVSGKTMNAVLVERLTVGLPFGGTLVVLTLFSEAMLLVVAAQAGFTDGPRVLANMAVDSWVPHRFAALSERLTTMNGIVLMGAAALAALAYTGGDVGHLVVMYSINVFLTFSLSMLSMLRYWRRRPRARGAGPATPALRRRVRALPHDPGDYRGGEVRRGRVGDHGRDEHRHRGVLPHSAALPGGARATWTGSTRCSATWRRGARQAAGARAGPRRRSIPAPRRRRSWWAPTAGSASTRCSTCSDRSPATSRNVVFLSVGVIDSGEFKGEHGIERLRERTEEMLARYVALAGELGVPATARMAIGTEAVAGAEQLCVEVSREFPRVVYFAGKLMFRRERWYHRLLHNETALLVEARLRWLGKTMVTLPIRVPDAR